VKTRIAIVILLFCSITSSAWGRVFVRWSVSSVPPASALGIPDLVISWNHDAGTLMKEARKQGYGLYLEVSLQEATTAAEKGSENGVAGVILDVPQSQRAEADRALPQLQAAHPKVKFLVLSHEGKLPEMRGGMVIKRDSVLEVSSPTAQPWIDSNLSLVRVEDAANPEQAPLYTFSWGHSDPNQPEKKITAADYSLVVAEAGAFDADVVLDVDERLQNALNAQDASAWKLWKEVSSYANFYSRSKTEQRREAVANVAVIVDDLDPSDEVVNLMARHNIPFRVLRPADLKGNAMENFDVIVVFAKPDEDSAKRIADLATRGKTVVLVDAQGSFPWHSGQSLRLNEHAVSYAIGSGKVLELGEPVADPETFAQDIRRLLGKEHSLISVWNGMTTLAVPYGPRPQRIEEIELVNYAGEPVRIQVQVRGSFRSVQYESPEHSCCESLAPVQHNGFTEFVIPDLQIAGRVHLVPEQTTR
jgi:protein-tyrosine-phosphatase